MENKEFRFEGLDAKTELKLALNLILPGLAVMIGTLILTNMLFPGIYFLYPLLFAAFLTLSVCMLILKQLAKRVKAKEWIVVINNENLKIKFQNLQYIFSLGDIKMIKNLGNDGFRYLTIITNKDVIKIRVGNTGLTPFSSEKDIEQLDDFVEYLMPYVRENFNQKELRNIINTNIFPNFGVYLVKREKIKYSIINKMEPWQVFVFGIGLFFVVLFILMQVLFYYFDNH
ncbi:hypothetical protein SAMN05421594_1633 [Chryseobacterium oleae]|uniref:Uncharacterized protein n=1 Tax=Chryseobacterium oleae TaxID=491207 RepID=A0A1I4XBP7_CHROL|nr:hypothetical protein [Chryseobacterium oleae]SFN22679.1 hypothetical protein SAMN05421594_1633 [Chryseobacterium oleae]